MEEQESLAPPSHWSPELREQWTRLSEPYRRLGKEILLKVIVDVDAQPVFLTYLRMTEACDTHAAWLKENGEIYQDRFGQPKRHPRVDVYRDCVDRQLKAFRHLGLDQESRGEEQGKLVFA